MFFNKWFNRKPKKRFFIAFFLEEGICVPRVAVTADSFNEAFAAAKKEWFKNPRDRVEFPVSVMLTHPVNDAATECRVAQWKEI